MYSCARSFCDIFPSFFETTDERVNAGYPCIPQDRSELVCLYPTKQPLEINILLNLRIEQLLAKLLSTQRNNKVARDFRAWRQRKQGSEKEEDERDEEIEEESGSEELDTTRDCNDCMTETPKEDAFSCVTCQNIGKCIDLCTICYKAQKFGHDPSHTWKPAPEADGIGGRLSNDDYRDALDVMSSWPNGKETPLEEIKAGPFRYFQTLPEFTRREKRRVKNNYKAHLMLSMGCGKRGIGSCKQCSSLKIACTWSIEQAE